MSQSQCELGFCVRVVYSMQAEIVGAHEGWPLGIFSFALFIFSPLF